jgi:hypothetical protein
MLKGFVLALVMVPLLAFGQAPSDDLFTKNNNIKSIASQIDRVTQEIMGSASTNILGVTLDDSARWTSYIDGLRNYATMVIAQPYPLDMPRTSHIVMEIPPSPAFQAVENQIANDMTTWLVLQRYELIKSQSSGLSSGLIPFDYERYMDVLASLDTYLALAGTIAPMDVPQTLSNIGDSPTAESRNISLP